jgi:hypothetical protein
MKELNLLRVISHRTCYASSDTLLRLFCSHIHTKLDYGQHRARSAHSFYHSGSRPLQTAATWPWVCLRGYQTTLMVSLHGEAGRSRLNSRHGNYTFNTFIYSSNTHNKSKIVRSQSQATKAENALIGTQYSSGCIWRRYLSESSTGQIIHFY